MEKTEGQPDVVDFDNATGEYTFYDCSKETPAGRRSVCYDQESLLSFGEFDTKTSSWIVAPGSIRKLDGGLFAHFRYCKIFVYHNGVESYYAVRGFRGFLKV